MRMGLMPLFLAGVVVGVVTVAASDAGAVWRRESAAACIQSNNYSGTYPVGIWGGTTPIGIGNFFDDDMLLDCSVQDDDRLYHSAVTTFNVHGTGNGGNFKAQACVGFFGAYGGACDAYSGTNTGGNVLLTPAHTKWNTYPFDMAYFEVTIPAWTNNVAQFKGWYVSN